MKGYEHKIGATLVEIVIVVAIIAALATMVVGIATHISNQSKEQLTKNTLALLNAALGQFRDYGYNYNPSTIIVAERDFFRGLDFPLDCNDFNPADLEQALGNALGLPPGMVSIDPPVHDDSNYSGSEVIYFFLSRISKSRKTLEKIDDSLITNEGSGKQPMQINIVFPGGPKIFPLRRVIDPWGTTLHYDYYPDFADYTGPGGLAGYLGRVDKSKRNFPEITSAGPDKIFGTGDDITNR
ncbi:MAG: hypothetical protein ACYS6W_12645 [Planctomycetota bacterium]|jgi:type II secretory pathway pseudopilin PulG